MRKTLLIILILSLIVLVSGCGSGGTGTSPGGIPDAFSDETYTATVTGKGVAPFTCKLVDATTIGGTLKLANNCVITGTAPHADNTRIIPFKVEMTDANSVSRVSEMHLTVHPPPVILKLDKKIEANLGEKFEHNFCKPKPGMNCGAESITPTGGNPPYTFTVSGQPMGLIMSLNGDLKGTIPEQAREGEYNVEVCVKDTKGDSDCKNTVIDVIEDSSLAISIKGKCIIHSIHSTDELGESYGEFTIKFSGSASGPVGAYLNTLIKTKAEDATDRGCGVWGSNCQRDTGEPATTDWYLEKRQTWWLSSSTRSFSVCTADCENKETVTEKVSCLSN